MSRRSQILPWIVVAAGVAVRLSAARGELWLDEMISLWHAVHAPSWLAIFDGIHSDNNHYLTSLWLRLLGEGHSPLLYRAPSLLAGAGTLAVVAAREKLEVLILFAASFILVQYDSEARGYAPMIFFAVACFELARQERGALFSICAVLGLSSHATFAFALAAFALWKWQRPGWFVAPIAALILFWTADWSVMARLGGTPEPLLDTLRRLARATLGTPLGPLELLAIPALGFAFLALGRSRERLFYQAIFLVPAAAVVVLQPSFVAPRYFLVCVPFFLILLGEIPRVAIAAIVLLGAAQIARLDRGHPQEVVQYMAEHTAGEVVRLSSDHKFRNWIVLEYYARGEPKHFEYVDGEGALWYVVHDFSDEPQPPAIRGYTLVLRTPFFGLSGWRFFLYRRDRSEHPSMRLNLPARSRDGAASSAAATGASGRTSPATAAAPARWPASTARPPRRPPFPAPGPGGSGRGRRSERTSASRRRPPSRRLERASGRRGPNRRTTGR
ncbi:MAG: hypothetical protein ABR567_04555 [Myxococcales bacterium]